MSRALSKALSGEPLLMQITGLSSRQYKLKIKKERWTLTHSMLHCKAIWTKAISDWFWCWTKYRRN